MTEDIHFGTVDSKLPDWKKEDIEENEDETTPRDVIAILGFDPSELKF